MVPRLRQPLTSHQHHNRLSLVIADIYVQNRPVRVRLNVGGPDACSLYVRNPGRMGFQPVY
jgi:hypothetical protein